MKNEFDSSISQKMKRTNGFIKFTSSKEDNFTNNMLHLKNDDLKFNRYGIFILNLITFYKLNFTLDRKLILKKTIKRNSSRNTTQDKHKNYSTGQCFRNDSSSFLNNLSNKGMNANSFSSKSKIVTSNERNQNEDHTDIFKSRNINSVSRTNGTELIAFADSQQSSSSYLGFKTLYSTNYI